MFRAFDQFLGSRRLDSYSIIPFSVLVKAGSISFTTPLIKKGIDTYLFQKLTNVSRLRAGKIKFVGIGLVHTNVAAHRESLRLLTIVAFVKVCLT